jgi:hypothetical protein
MSAHRMRRLVLPAVATLLALGALPVHADEAADDPDEDLVECTNPGGLEEVDREGLSSTIDTPVEPLWEGSEFKNFLVDLSPGKVNTRASLTVTMTWDVPTDDYDLFVSTSLDAGDSQDWQIETLEGAESVTVLVRHCDVITVEARNWAAAVFVQELSLDFAVTNVVTP